MPTLYIHPRKGLFQLTRCKDCGHNFQCQNCDANLVTYRTSTYKIELICHQCQSFYSYPNKCSICASQNISSMFAGIDELINTLDSLSGQKSFQFGSKNAAPDWFKKISTGLVDKIEAETKMAPEGVMDEESLTFSDQQTGFKIQITQNKSKLNILSDVLENLAQGENVVTTRVFDPQLNYFKFNKIVFVQADNLLASPDYLVQEDTHKQLAEVLARVNPESTIYFDTVSPENAFFNTLLTLNSIHPENQSVSNWYKSFLLKESGLREKFKFPPFYNLLLITSQEKDKQKSLSILHDIKNYLLTIKAELPEIEIGSPYPARFLKRKNMFSYHILLRYPKGYSRFSVLRQTVGSLALQKHLQIRLNPKHLF